MDKKKMLLIGYMPLLYPKGIRPGDLFENEAALEKAAEFSSFESQHIRACLWADDGGDTIRPVFVLEKAKEVYDHLLFWADGDLQARFSLVIVCRTFGDIDTYAVCLWPNPQKTIERVKEARFITHGEFITGVNYEVIQAPLIFFAKSTASLPNTVARNRNRLPKPGSKTKLGFVDHVDMTTDEGVKYVELTVSDDKLAVDWCSAFLEKEHEDA